MNILRTIYNYVAFFAVILIGLVLCYGWMSLPKLIVEAVQ